MDPFATLNLPIKCTDEEVRQAYQRLLRRFPPETHPAQFQQINTAYTSLRTERQRWRQFVFGRQEAQNPMEAMEEFYHSPARANPPGSAPFRHLLAACARPASAKPANKSGTNRSKK